MWKSSPLNAGRVAAQALVVVCACALASRSAHAANLFLQVDTPSVTLTPTATDYGRDYVELTGASGIQLRLKTNAALGISVLVRCSDPAPGIALSDLLVRTLTPPGIGGRSLSTYSVISATHQLLWSSAVSLAPFTSVATDIRVRNLMNYSDSPGGGTTGYTNTLTFTVVSP